MSNLNPCPQCGRAVAVVAHSDGVMVTCECGLAFNRSLDGMTHKDAEEDVVKKWNEEVSVMAFPIHVPTLNGSPMSGRISANVSIGGKSDA